MVMGFSDHRRRGELSGSDDRCPAAERGFTPRRAPARAVNVGSPTPALNVQVGDRWAGFGGPAPRSSFAERSQNATSSYVESRRDENHFSTATRRNVCSERTSVTWL